MFLSFILIYLLGGFTFLPLLIVLYLFRPFQPKKNFDENNISTKAYAKSISDSPEKVLIQDWIRLSPTFLNGNSGSVKIHEIEESPDGKVESHALLSDLKIVNEDGKTTRYCLKNPKDVYFVKLIDGQLLLHDPLNTHCLLRTLDLEDYHIKIFPSEVSENEAFSNRNAVLLKPTSDKQHPQSSPISLECQNLYLYARSPSKKEDWYFKLLSFSKTCPPLRPTDGPASFDYYSVKNNLDNLSSPDLTWLNAFIGRIYLGIHKSEGFKNTVKHKLSRKLSKISTPEMMSDIQVTNVDVGESIPIVDNLELVSISEAGELNVSADILYQGDCSFKAETAAKLKLGSKIPSKKVTFSLVIRLRHLSGRVRLLIKPPPSNRIWYGFYEDPKIELHVEPMVLQKQLSNSYLLNYLRNKLLDLIFDTMVLPHMNDIAFFSDDPCPIKGGLYNSKDSYVNITGKTEDTKNNKKKVESPEPQIDEADRNSIKSHESDVKDFDLAKSLSKDLSDSSDNCESDDESKSTQSQTSIPITNNFTYAMRDDKSIKSIPAERKSIMSRKTRPKFWNDSSQSTISDATKKYGVAAKKSFFQGISEAKSLVKKLQANYTNSSDDEDDNLLKSNLQEPQTKKPALNNTSLEEEKLTGNVNEKESLSVSQNEEKKELLPKNHLSNEYFPCKNGSSQFVDQLQMPDSSGKSMEEPKEQFEGQKNSTHIPHESINGEQLPAKELELNTIRTTSVDCKHKLPRRPLPNDVFNENSK
ncbi:eukaryotic protein [Schizosaccharomyces cryophilus OY26]|uniref:Eukaryotic protein n=1 Tax=Schizosaccharomyces cryophilus (strain OY26 / ATCC MYA-4695 / CBS 11777 / NBRC 106824 / NRRL Y48691) TaxID=653667 RepID=S9X754_SCHCR|nr:uncharacterized protein SPOG_01490 [Schizosaccharomyces cryophilus OY26]EPY49606.1 eukaryotic protein [Schizosaccharomyces cryophilus OY26]